MTGAHAEVQIASVLNAIARSNAAEWPPACDVLGTTSCDHLTSNTWLAILEIFER
jgi:hypothetical protein